MSVAAFTKSGTKATAPAKLDKSIFGLGVANHQLLKDAYLCYLADARNAGAKTKRRGEVRGGGRKPWRQKGTGNARFGSSRNPIWRGGGVAFGPTGNENYSVKLNLKSKRQALRQALSLAASEDRIKIIETFECKEGKVKPTLNLLSKIGSTGNTLIVVSHKADLVERATRNLVDVKAVQANYLSVFDVLNADTIILSRESVELIVSRLSTKATEGSLS